MLTRDHEFLPRSVVARLRLGDGFFDSLHITHVARKFAPHFYDRFAIGVVESGRCRITTHRGSWVATPRSLLTFSPGEIHTAALLNGDLFSYRMIYLGTDAMRELGAEVGQDDSRQPLFRSPVVHAPPIAELLRNAHVVWMDDQRSWRTERDAESQLIAVVRELLRSHGNPRGNVEQQRRADIEAVERGVSLLSGTGNVRIGAVADECSMSPFQLIRVFRRVVGITPYAYHMLLRVNRARQLLNEGTPVAQAAYSCGFSDQSHLTRMFKRTLGLPPGQYVRAIGRSRASDCKRASS